MKVIISNGHFKFILGSVATEIHKYGLLKLFITAGYPTPIASFLVHTFARSSKGGARLLDRKEGIPNSLVRTIWLSELIQKFSALLFPPASSELYAWYRFSLVLYSWKASRLIKKTNADIYHYRAGYGRGSVVDAKIKGMITICDHSLAHPRVLDYLIENGGKLPPLDFVPPVTKFWADVEADINQADYVIVNSDFVKETFLNRGWVANRIFVAYAGLDDELVNNKPVRALRLGGADFIRFQFAGEGCPRKGLPDLLRAFQEIDDLPWHLTIVGDIRQSVLDEFGHFLKDSRINVTPFCSRNELLSKMGEADVFIFPSLAEGSARVTYMAMAMGCFIITTKNSGSVVQEIINGEIVEPGNVASLREAIRNTFAHKEKLKNVGKINAATIANQYTQSAYGKRIVDIYEQLI